MKHLLSSRLTFFFKAIFPTLWLGGFAVGTFSMWADAFARGSNDPDLAWVKWHFLLLLILGAAFLYWCCIRLKKVEVDEAGFHISNYFSTVTVPLNGLKRVSGSVMMSPELVWLEFHENTEFGRKIVFMPPLRVFGGMFARHPIVGHLTKLVRSA